MQSPFVLCRLSYKHKESVKDPNFNHAGPAVSSPSILFPASEMQATLAPENFGKTISTTIAPVDWDGKSFSAHAAENQLGELTATEVRKELSLSVKQLFIFSEKLEVFSITSENIFLKKLLMEKIFYTIPLSNCNENGYNATASEVNH